MPTGSTLALFLAAALLLLIVPGPSVLYIVARSIEQGRRAGLVSAVGVGAGALVHVAAATVGLSALLVSSALAFAVVKYAGAAYLVFLGLRTLLARDEARAKVGPAPRRLRRVFSQAVVVEVLNPKVALFFFAFLPQFIDPARGTVAGQTLLLGGLFVLLGICSDGLYALAAGTAGTWLKGSTRFGRVRRYATGGVYLGLGLTTAVASGDRP